MLPNLETHSISFDLSRDRASGIVLTRDRRGGLLRTKVSTIAHPAWGLPKTARALYRAAAIQTDLRDLD